MVWLSYVFPLYVSLLRVVSPLLCKYCDGEPFGTSTLSLSRDGCCEEKVRECSAGLVCIRALVTAPTLQFVLSGCHPPEDSLLGCDTHSLPHNASVYRCSCLDSSCQNLFPSGCPIQEPRVTSISYVPNVLTTMSSTTTTLRSTTTSSTSDDRSFSSISVSARKHLAPTQALPSVDAASSHGLCWLIFMIGHVWLTRL